MSMIKVKNRSQGTVVYKIPELNLRREFSPAEVKSISEDEIEKVLYQAGGRELFYNFLQIEDPKAAAFLMNREIAPEYWLDEKNLSGWMVSCSLDEFKDCLDFAPEGVKELIKEYAVKMPLNDNAKREAILEMLNFNVSSAIAHDAEARSDDQATSDTGAGRRASATTINVPQTSAPAGTTILNLK